MDRMTMDSLLLPWDPVAKHAMQHKGGGAPDVMQIGGDYQRGPDAHGQAWDSKGADMTEGACVGPYVGQQPDPRHAPAGRALGWKETFQQAGAAYAPAAQAINATEASHFIRECQPGAVLLAAARPRDLDVDGVASTKATLVPEAYSQRRGRGKPPQNSGAAPIGQAFIERGPARPAAYGKGPGQQAKPGGGSEAVPRRALSHRGRSSAAIIAAGRRTERATRKSVGDEGTWHPIASDRWYEKKHASFGDLGGQFCGKAVHRSAAGVRPLLPATKFSGIMLPVRWRSPT